MDIDNLCQYIDGKTRKLKSKQKTTISSETQAFSELDDASMLTLPTDEEDSDEDLEAMILSRF